MNKQIEFIKLIISTNGNPTAKQASDLGCMEEFIKLSQVNCSNENLVQYAKKVLDKYHVVY